MKSKMFWQKMKKSRYNQYIYSMAAMSSMIIPSAHFTWTSPIIPQLLSEDSPIGVQLSVTETSLIASLLFAGLAIGSTCASLPLEHLGRKKTLLISHIPSVVSGILILFANSAVWLYMARLSIGTATGLCLSTGPVYNSEIAENDIRGKISNLINIMMLIGNLYGYCIGPFVSYKVLAITFVILPILTFALCALVPESPYYLVKIGKVDEARGAIKKLSSATSSDNFIDERLKEMTENIENNYKNKSSVLELFKKKYRNSLTITIILRLIMYFCGYFCIFPYLQTIVQQSGSTIPSRYVSIIFGILNLLIGILSGQIVDKLGRKPIFVLCCFVSALTLFVEGIYFYFYEKTSYDVSSLSWLPVAVLLVYEIFIILGLKGLPFIIISEIFPMNVKGVALSLNSFLGAPLGLMVSMTFQPIMKNWGAFVPFWIYGACCTIGFFYGIFFLPETKGKSFAEIQKEIN